MVLPAELIDHIFSFLQSSSALTACSKAHPLLSRIAERFIYEHIVFNRSALEDFNLILENPRLLKYPRTLEIRGDLIDSDLRPMAIPLVVMLVIPRMANLISLTIRSRFDQSDEFISAFRKCIQQLSFQLEELRLFHMYRLPFSVLDEAKSVKQLTLSDCEVEDGPISGSPSSQLSLETLVLSGLSTPEVYSWAKRWVTRLTTLKLQELMPGADWTAFPELLAACSNSLTWLHLDMGFRSYTQLSLPLSTLLRLKKLSISARINKEWALPGIIRLINTASTVQDVALRFHFHVSSVTFLGKSNWSLLDRLHSNSTGKRPCIDLCVTGGCFLGCPFRSEDILDALGASEALMDLVKRGLVTLRAERRY